MSGDSSAASRPLALKVQMVGIVAIGCVAAVTTGQIGGLVLSDVAGGLGVSLDNASWLTTVFLAAQAFSVPLAPVLTMAIGPRRVLIAAATIVCAGAFIEVSSADFATVLVSRALQGGGSGMFSIMTMLLVMQSFPPGQGQREGLLVFAAATSVGLGLSASLGGIFVTTFAWTGPALFNLAWAGIMLVAVLWAFPSQPAKLKVLRTTHWAGYLLFASGCAALVVALMQGNRRFWFESEIVTVALAIGLSLSILAVLELMRSKNPFIELRLLAVPTFGGAIFMALTLRFALLVVAFVVPQYLTRLQDFRVENIAHVTIWLLPIHALAFPLAYLLGRYLDARLLLMTGLVAFASAAFLNVDLSPAWATEQFRLSMIFLGVGQAFFVYALLLFATHGLDPSQGPTAGTLFNMTRVVGQALGTAFLSTLVTKREQFHSNIIVENLTNGSDATDARLSEIQRGLAPHVSDGSLLAQQSVSELTSEASDQAYVLAYVDAFFILGAILLTIAFFAWMFPDIRPAQAKAPAGEVRS